MFFEQVRKASVNRSAKTVPRHNFVGLPMEG
jgi:hypothetical protein